MKTLLIISEYTRWVWDSNPRIWGDMCFSDTRNSLTMRTQHFLLEQTNLNNFQTLPIQISGRMNP